MSWFKSFTRSVPQVSIFHNASSPPSMKALQMLQGALSNPYPPQSSGGQPLKFELEVVENAPTPDQIKTLLESYLGPAAKGGASAFLSGHPAAAGETSNSPESIAKLVSSSPKSFKWPVVVDWTNGKAIVGEADGVKSILDEIYKKQGGS